MTPKSLLREPLVACEMEQFTSGRFQRVMPDPDFDRISKPSRILLCTGKIGVDLLKEREQRDIDDVAIVRMEQLYPIPRRELQEVLGEYPDATPVTWVQEEPSNMGAWQFIKVNFDDLLFQRWPLIGCVTRPESASPSTGSKKTHKIEQEELLSEALATPIKVKAARA